MEFNYLMERPYSDECVTVRLGARDTDSQTRNFSILPPDIGGESVDGILAECIVYQLQQFPEARLTKGGSFETDRSTSCSRGRKREIPESVPIPKIVRQLIGQGYRIPANYFSVSKNRIIRLYEEFYQRT